MRLLDRYILAEWAKVFALALLSFVGIMLLSDGYNRIPEFLDLGAGWGTIIAYLLLGLVRNLSLLIPISLLISVIFVLATMNRNHEISAARAAGITYRQRELRGSGGTTLATSYVPADTRRPGGATSGSFLPGHCVVTGSISACQRPASRALPARVVAPPPPAPTPTS